MSIILKASQDPAEDFYIEFSTIMDQPLRWGRASYVGVDEERKERTDETGTSEYPFHFAGISHPGRGAFDSKGVLIRDFGTQFTDFYLPRRHFRDFFLALGSDSSREGQDRAIELFGEDLEG